MFSFLLLHWDPAGILKASGRWLGNTAQGCAAPGCMANRLQQNEIARAFGRSAREPHDGPRWGQTNDSPCCQQTASHATSSYRASRINAQIAARLRSYAAANLTVCILKSLTTVNCERPTRIYFVRHGKPRSKTYWNLHFLTATQKRDCSAAPCC